MRRFQAAPHRHNASIAFAWLLQRGHAARRRRHDATVSRRLLDRTWPADPEGTVARRGPGRRTRRAAVPNTRRGALGHRKTPRRDRCPCSSHRKKKLPGVRVHRCRRIHPDDISLVDSIPVTSIERTLCDLATVLPYADLKRAFENSRAPSPRRPSQAPASSRAHARHARRRTMRQLLGYDPRPRRRRAPS